MPKMTGGRFIADLTTRTGGCSGKGFDTGRVVVGLDFDQHIDVLWHLSVLVVGIGGHAQTLAAGKHRRVVLVGREHAAGMRRVGVADHREQGVLLGTSVQRPTGVEDLVSAVFAIGLGKHHQFDVGGVASHFGEG